jgi:DNA-binding winged helix-turn-helix (wHTH) protein/Tol biopolymer transport system component
MGEPVSTEGREGTVMGPGGNRMERSSAAVYEFGPYRLEVAKRLLLRSGKPLALAPKTFDLLVLLVESQSRVLTKKELMSALWPDSFVEEANLSFQMHALRKALGEHGAEWIENLPRYGYRFSGEVTIATPEPETPRTQPPQLGNGRPAEAPAPPIEAARTEISAPPVPSKKRIHFGALLPLLAICLTGVVIIWRTHEKPAPLQSVRFQISAPAGITLPDLESILVSPDGTRLAFIGAGPDGRTQLWLRPLDALDSEPIPGTDFVTSAFWAPNGNSIGFFAAGKLRRIDLPGGATQTICDTPTGRGTWNRDGVILFDGGNQPEILRVPASGGTPVRVTELDSANQETIHSSPQFLPDGKHFIYFAQSTKLENNGIRVGSLDAKESKPLVTSNTNAIIVSSAQGKHYLLFTRGTDLMAQLIDVDKLFLAAQPILVTHGVLIGVTRGLARAAISGSVNGVLAYRTRVEMGSTELVWLDRQGKKLGLVAPSADYSNPSLSRDEKKLVVSRLSPQSMTRDLWVFDLSSGAQSRFTFDPADETNAVWSPDGSSIAYSVVRKSAVDLYLKPATGAADPKQLLTTGRDNQLEDWTPDSRFLLFRIDAQTWALPLPSGDPIGPYAMEYPRISPDGRWVAYTSAESGRSEVYVQSFPPAHAKWQVSAQGGIEPCWRSDGKELFYISGDHLVAVDVKTSSGVFQAGVSRPLFEIYLESTRRHSRYQVASNGNRFLVNLPVESRSAITVAINWNPASGH